MSFLRRLFKKKKGVIGEEDVRYILKKQLPGQGMTKVADLKEPTPIDDLYQNLVPGLYSLHKYKKGQSGFEVVWGPIEVTGETPKEGAVQPARVGGPLSGLRQWAEEMKQTKEDLAVVADVLAPMMGYTKPGEVKQKTVIEQLKEAKTEQQTLNELFPLANTASQQIPISGSIPAALAYAPTMIDQSLDAVEKRLRRWGLVEEEGVGEVEHKEIIKLPEKPKRAEKEEAKEVEKGTLKLPPKPETKAEVKEVNIEKEEKEGEEKEGNERTEESGK